MQATQSAHSSIANHKIREPPSAPLGIHCLLQRAARKPPPFDIQAQALSDKISTTDLRLVQVDDVRVAVGLEAISAPLATDTALLVATEDGLRSGLLEGVDEDGAGLEASGDLLGVLDVLAPDTGTETGVGVVGTLDDLLLVRPGLGGDNGAERLLGDDAAVVGRVVDDGRLDEEALLGRGGVLADGELVAVLLSVREEFLDLLVLHLVLDRAEEGAGFGVTDLDGLGEVDHLGEELGVDALVDVDTLGGDTDLARVLEGTHDDLGSDLLDIDVRQDDGGVVAAELEGAALEGVGASSHDLLTSGDGTSERDLGNAGVGGKHRTELVITTNGLDDTGLEDRLCELNGLECCVGSEGTGLDNDGVTSQQGRDDLAHGEDKREVPGMEVSNCLVSREWTKSAHQGQMAPTTPRGVYLVVRIFSSSSTRSSGRSRDRKWPKKAGTMLTSMEANWRWS
jgi:hypothetical protein